MGKLNGQLLHAEILGWGSLWPDPSASSDVIVTAYALGSARTAAPRASDGKTKTHAKAGAMYQGIE